MGAETLTTEAKSNIVRITSLTSEDLTFLFGIYFSEHRLSSPNIHYKIQGSTHEDALVLTSFNPEQGALSVLDGFEGLSLRQKVVSIVYLSKFVERECDIRTFGLKNHKLTAEERENLELFVRELYGKNKSTFLKELEKTK